MSNKKQEREPEDAKKNANRDVDESWIHLGQVNDGRWIGYERSAFLARLFLPPDCGICYVENAVACIELSKYDIKMLSARLDVELQCNRELVVRVSGFIPPMSAFIGWKQGLPLKKQCEEDGLPIIFHE